MLFKVIYMKVCAIVLITTFTSKTADLAFPTLLLGLGLCLSFFPDT